MEQLIVNYFMLFLFGIVISAIAIFYILFNGIPAGTKGITDEYTSPSGKKRTAKKEREEHIV